MAAALWVVAKMAPSCVPRRSFGVTKLLSSRLDWGHFSPNGVDSDSADRPWDRCGWAQDWTEDRSRSYGSKEDQVQACLDKPGLE